MLAVGCYFVSFCLVYKPIQPILYGIQIDSRRLKLFSPRIFSYLTVLYFAVFPSVLSIYDILVCGCLCLFSHVPLALALTFTAYQHHKFPPSIYLLCVVVFSYSLRSVHFELNVISNKNFECPPLSFIITFFLV